MVDKINGLINLIKENILKLDDITINETIYILKEELNNKKEIHYRTKIKEDIKLNKIEQTLQKIYTNRLKNENNKDILFKLEENYSKIEPILNSERNIILYCRNLRETEIETIKQKIKEEEINNINFELDKELLKNILNNFIHSLQINNLEGKYTNEYLLTNKFTAFLDNKRPLNPKIIEYFNPIIKEIIFENCIVFSSTIEEVKELLLTKDIKNILITHKNPSLSK